ncbi:V-type ATP synthase subunit E [Candidatus Aerophobetes bacterium]|uniref:V-type ATP synthase subunit E n=1 Tax=Aerophobetes bacterium TaxID=2030807 RepID=A0A2A4YI34_UNCAE|nr:MAG: V-type ATP synthase subunit E [Candidatus Aerophobetes bacterium]
MEVLDSGQDKVKKICDALRKETLDPAKKEAKGIVDKAILEAEKIVLRAKKDAESIYEENKKKMKQERNVLQSSLNLACKQSIEALRQEIEENLFNRSLAKEFKEKASTEEVVVSFINVVVQAIEKEGLKGDIDVIIPKHLSKDTVANQLAANAVSRLRESSLVLEDRMSGIEVKMKKEHLTIEMSDQTLLSLFSRFVREEFRSLLFETKPS